MSQGFPLTWTGYGASCYSQRPAGWCRKCIGSGRMEREAVTTAQLKGVQRRMKLLASPAREAGSPK